jgi:hypothetical protein
VGKDGKVYGCYPVVYNSTDVNISAGAASLTNGTTYYIAGFSGDYP